MAMWCIKLIQLISFFLQLFSTTVHVTAVVVEYETPTKRINKGVATTWLRELKPVDPEKKLLCPVFIRKSQFRYGNLERAF